MSAESTCVDANLLGVLSGGEPAGRNSAEIIVVIDPCLVILFAGVLIKNSFLSSFLPSTTTKAEPGPATFSWIVNGMLLLITGKKLWVDPLHRQNQLFYLITGVNKVLYQRTTRDKHEVAFLSKVI